MDNLIGGINLDEIKSDQLSEVYKDLCSLIGLENTLLIYKNYRGQQISFPLKLISREYITSQIKEECSTTDIKGLAAKYGYSERWIREIIKRRNEVKEKLL